MREPVCDRHGFSQQRVIGHDAVDQADPQSLIRGDLICEEIQLPGFRRPHQAWNEIAAAKIAGTGGIGEDRGEHGIFGDDAQIAGGCQTQPGARRGTPHHRNRRFRHMMQQRRRGAEFHDMRAPHLDIPPGGRAADAHTHRIAWVELFGAADIAAGANPASGAGQNHHAHFRIAGGFFPPLDQQPHQFPGQSI